LLGAYPTLFCHGIGGISDSSRKIKLSYRDHANYLMLLNDDRFRTHRSFLFVVFNILQRAEARNRMNLLVNMKDFPSFATELAKLTL
jgi:hypothetical protein